MATAAVRLRALLETERPDGEAIRVLLDGLSHADRLDAIRSLSGPRIQHRLWDAARDAPRVTLDQLVPRSAGSLREVIWHGKNSLPAASAFQKRFCRPPHDDGSLWGYNHQSLGWITGPGYFVVHEDGARGAAIDYREVPPRGAPGWPSVRPNHVGLSFFIYRNMVDYLRRVAEHVLIGRATRGGRDLGNFFVLCREP